jgi:hypothetical protein
MRKSLSNPMLQQSPDILYWIQIRRIYRPDYLVHTVRVMVLLRQLSYMLRSTVFHEDYNLPRIFWVASHPLHESIYKRKNVFSIHCACNTTLFFLEYHEIPLPKYRYTSVNYPGRRALKLRYTTGIQILLLGKPSYIRFSKALCGERALIRPDNTGLYLRSLF